jgi:hypothetical protein
MEKLTFLISLRRAFDAFEDEMKKANEAPYWEYFRFLKTLGFQDFMEQVFTACVMYPRSYSICEDNLNDLAYGMYNDLGIGKFYLSHSDKNRLADLILLIGREVMSAMTANGYYLPETRFPRGWKEDPDFETDVTAIPDVRRVGTFSFKVEITERHIDDPIDLPQNTGGLQRPRIRSY